jgi:hypothetical protein
MARTTPADSGRVKPGNRDDPTRPLGNPRYEQVAQGIAAGSTHGDALRAAGYSETVCSTPNMLTGRHDKLILRRAEYLAKRSSAAQMLTHNAVLQQVSERAQGTIADFADIIGLPWDEAAEKLRRHPHRRAVKSLERKVYTCKETGEIVEYVGRIDLHPPLENEKFLAEQMGWGQKPTETALLGGLAIGVGVGIGQGIAAAQRGSQAAAIDIEAVEGDSADGQTAGQGAGSGAPEGWPVVAGIVYLPAPISAGEIIAARQRERADRQGEEGGE